MSWTKRPGLPAKNNPCLNCPPIPATASLDKLIAVGFGSATVCKDGETVLDGERQANEAEGPEWFPTFADAERLVLADPDHDWTVELWGPLHGEVYQRQGIGEWVLVETNQGFA